MTTKNAVQAFDHVYAALTLATKAEMDLRRAALECRRSDINDTADRLEAIANAIDEKQQEYTQMLLDRGTSFY